MKKALIFVLAIGSLHFSRASFAAGVAEAAPMLPATGMASGAEYTVGAGDVLDVSILRPEQFQTTLTVSPDGTIMFPYLGNVPVKDMTLTEIRDDLARRLTSLVEEEPVVTVSLKESHSRVFYAYGEVIKPGSYPMQDNLTIIRAISMAGGFTKFGSPGRVKILRQKADGSGNEILKADVKAAMNGNEAEDVKIESGDVITVSAGIF